MSAGLALLVAADDGVRERFYGRVVQSESCHMWTGYVMPSGYGLFTIRQFKLLAHRSAWVLAGNNPPPDGFVIDHICKTKQCVNPAHLRVGTQSQNLANTGPRGGSSPYKGVSSSKAESGWRAFIRVNGRSINLGRFATQEAAAIAYNEAARLHFGEFAYLNEVAA